MARRSRLCEQHAASSGPDAAAYYLMGVIHQARRTGQRAEEYFHKAVYLDPGHDEALLALALIAERRGDCRRGCEVSPPRGAGAS